jgi:hypothetical protein
VKRLPAALVAAAIGVAVGTAAALAVGGLIVISMMILIMPSSDFAPYLLGGLLLAIFGFVFVVVFREMMEKLTG